MTEDTQQPVWEKWRNVIAAIAAIVALLGVAAVAAQTFVDVGGVNQQGPNIDNSSTRIDCGVQVDDVSGTSSVSVNIGGSVCD